MNVGAPVKLEGVQIGEVKEVALLFDDETMEVIKPVVIELDYKNILDDKISKICFIFYIIVINFGLFNYLY